VKPLATATPKVRGLWYGQAREVGFRLLAPTVALAVAAVIGMVVVAVVQRNVADVFSVLGAMWDYGIRNPDAPAFIFSRATPFIFAGLATSIAFKAGLFNIGVEGQYAIGALTAAVVASYVHAPAVIHLPLTIAAGMAGGLLWALIPALLKVYRGAHEVISTIMMNYLSAGILLYLLSGVLKDRTQLGSIAQDRTIAIQSTAHVGSMVPFLNSFGFDLRESLPITWFFVVALAAAAIYAFVIQRTRFGYEVRVVGTNSRAAEPAGIHVNSMFLKVMLISGAIAGLAGLQDVLGIDGFMKLDYVRGYGFTGIAIALLGRNTGIGIVAASLLFAFLDRSASGIGLETEVPKEVTVILQGVILLTIVIAYSIVGRVAARTRLREVRERA
jgi:simple sugar transport system permease protein